MTNTRKTLSSSQPSRRRSRRRSRQHGIDVRSLPPSHSVLVAAKLVQPLQLVASSFGVRDEGEPEASSEQDRLHDADWFWRSTTWRLFCFSGCSGFGVAFN
jgi:hypothetical protein